MNTLQWLLQFHELCEFQTKEGAKVGKASKSELKRWIQNGVVHINGVRMNINDEVDTKNIESIVFFPNNKKAITTLW